MLLIGLLLPGCTSSEAECQACPAAIPAQFLLACGTGDLTNVVATGPCSMQDAAPAPFQAPVAPYDVGVYSAAAGDCHVELGFSSGFTYSLDVTFEAAPSDACTGCPPVFVATAGPFLVKEPGSTCTLPPDAGGGSVRGTR